MTDQLHLLSHVVFWMSLLVGLVGATCVLTGAQFDVGNGPRVRQLFSEIATSLSRQNFPNWPRAIVNAILATLHGISGAVTILTVISMLLLPFWFLHVNKFVFDLSTGPGQYYEYTTQLKEVRDFWVHCSLLLMAVQFLTNSVPAIWQAFKNARGASSDQAPALVGFVVWVGLITILTISVVLTYRLTSLYWWYYPIVLKASLTGSLSQIALAQLWMFPITLSAVAFPTSLAMVLATTVVQFIRSIRAPEAQSFESGYILGARGQGWAQSFASGVSLSFVITVAAMAMGTLFDPAADSPVSIQLLISNAIFDGMTLAVTLSLFRWVTVTSNLLLIGRLIIALIVDVTIAAAFALASLYFSFAGTSHALPIDQLIYVLIGHAAIAPHVWEFGPLFWVMHSSFLPTLAVWIVIVSSTMLAIAFSFLETFVSKPAYDTKPLVAFGTLLGAWSIILGGVSYVSS